MEEEVRSKSEAGKYVFDFSITLKEKYLDIYI